MSVLSGMRILVVEDEFVVGLMLEEMLSDLGATVIGPVPSLAKGLSLAETEAVDAAVLDVNLNGERVEPLAKILSERGTPLVFATGYGEGSICNNLHGTVLEKPCTQERLAAAVGGALASREPQSG